MASTRFTCCVRKLQLKFLRHITEFHHSCASLQKLSETTQDISDPRITEIIDVRTESEFKIDHIPGSINCPVLTNSQHQEVGIQYVTDSFKARQKGAMFVSQNISSHIEHYFQYKDRSYCPLVYCKRGGQRSRSLALVLAEIGFQVFVFEGGFKMYRKKVREELETLPQKINFKVLTGLTGSGKTYLLKQLSAAGEQVLDLEELAKHKGSVLGLWHNEEQPSQKYFTSLLRDRLVKFDPKKPVWVESESRAIGNVVIPETLFQRICAGEYYRITIPMSQRVQHIIRDYPNWISDTESLKATLTLLEKYHGKKKLHCWFDLISSQKFEVFVESILREHYDPTYTKSQTKALSTAKQVKDIKLDNLNENSVNEFLSGVFQS